MSGNSVCCGGAGVLWSCGGRAVVLWFEVVVGRGAGWAGRDGGGSGGARSGLVPDRSDLRRGGLHRRASRLGSSSRGRTRGAPGCGRCPRGLFLVCSLLQGKTTATAVRAVDCVDNGCSACSSPAWRCGRTRGVTRGQIGAPGENYGCGPFGPQGGRVVPGCIPGCGLSSPRVLHRVIVAWISPGGGRRRGCGQVGSRSSPGCCAARPRGWSWADGVEGLGRWPAWSRSGGVGREGL